MKFEGESRLTGIIGAFIGAGVALLSIGAVGSSFEGANQARRVTPAKDQGTKIHFFQLASLPNDTTSQTGNNLTQAPEPMDAVTITVNKSSSAQPHKAPPADADPATYVDISYPTLSSLGIPLSELINWETANPSRGSHPRQSHMRTNAHSENEGKVVEITDLSGNAISAVADGNQLRLVAVKYDGQIVRASNPDFSNIALKTLEASPALRSYFVVQPVQAPSAPKTPQPN